MLFRSDRVVVDTGEWDELRPTELREEFDRTALSDIAWARTLEWRRALAGYWPEIRDQEIRIAGPLAEAELLRGWLVDRLERGVRAVTQAAELSVSLDGIPIPAPRIFAVTPSDRLSAELDRYGRDSVYEAAVRATEPVLGA